MEIPFRVLLSLIKDSCSDTDFRCELRDKDRSCPSEGFWQVSEEDVKVKTSERVEYFYINSVEDRQGSDHFLSFCLVQPHFLVPALQSLAQLWELF